VTGAFASGKTEFICTISEAEIFNPIFTLKNGRSVSFDAGQVVIGENLFLQFYGNPGAVRSDAVFMTRKQGMLGAIVMVDSTQPTTFREARSILETLRAYRQEFYPYIVACNKQDRADAWSPEDLRIALRARKDEVFLPCVATDKESVKNVLLVLLQQILDSFEAWGI